MKDATRGGKHPQLVEDLPFIATSVVDVHRLQKREQTQVPVQPLPADCSPTQYGLRCVHGGVRQSIERGSCRGERVPLGGCVERLASQRFIWHLDLHAKKDEPNRVDF